MFEGIESAVDGEEEEDLREFGEDGGRHIQWGLEFVTEGDEILWLGKLMLMMMIGEGVVENFQHFQFNDKKKLNGIG